MNKITKTMTNEQIYRIAIGFYKNFNGDLILPIKVNFYLTKNKNYFLELGQQIEEFRDKIRGDYDKLKELSELQQEVSFYQVSLEDFGDINLSMEQLETLEFMIKEE
jgi:hypothetical protein